MDTYLEREGGAFLEIFSKLPIEGDGLLVLTSLEAVHEVHERFGLRLQLPAQLGPSAGDLSQGFNQPRTTGGASQLTNLAIAGVKGSFSPKSLQVSVHASLVILVSVGPSGKPCNALM